MLGSGGVGAVLETALPCAGCHRQLVSRSPETIYDELHAFDTVHCQIMPVSIAEQRACYSAVPSTTRSSSSRDAALSTCQHASLHWQAQASHRPRLMSDQGAPHL